MSKLGVRITISKLEGAFDLVVRARNKKGDRSRRHAGRVVLTDVGTTLEKLVAELEQELGPI